MDINWKEGLFSVQKVFGYARTSTTHQHEDRQVEALLQYGVEDRNIIVDKESGKDFNRAGYISLKENLLRPGDTLVIKELDRLGRNKAMIKKELEWLKAEGIRVRILNVPTTLIDCGDQDWVMDMISNVLIEVMASIAEEERVKIHRRQEEGIAAAKAKGVAFGRPVVAKPEHFDEIMALVDSGQLKAVDAMRELGLKKTTFYRYRRAYLTGH